MMENQEKIENEEVVESTTTETTPESKPKKKKKAKDPNAPKGWKGWSKGKKIGVVSGAVAGGLVLIILITMVCIIFIHPPVQAAPPAENVQFESNYNRDAEGNYIGVTIGTSGSELILEDMLILDDIVPNTYNAIEGATIEDRVVGDETKHVLIPNADAKKIKIGFQQEVEKKEETPATMAEPTTDTDTTTDPADPAAPAEPEKVIVDSTMVIDVVADGINVNTEEDLHKYINKESTNKKVYMQSDVIIPVREQDMGALFFMDGMELYANKHMLDASNLIFKSSVLYVSGRDVLIQDLHLIGDFVPEDQKVDLGKYDNKDVADALIEVRGDKSKGVEGKAEATFNHCTIQNGHKMMFVSNADVTVKNSVLLNAADAMIAVETNDGPGSVLNVENVIESNSSVVGILFCGWTNVDGKEDYTRCTLNVNGFLDIYNWKDTKTTKLIPQSEGATADLINGKIAGEIEGILRKPDQVAKYLVKGTNEAGEKEYYLHLGIVILATPGLSENTTTITGMDQSGYMANTTYQKRAFPLPFYAKPIAKTCELIGYDQHSIDSNPNAVKPGDKFQDSQHYQDIVSGATDLPDYKG